MINNVSRPFWFPISKAHNQGRLQDFFPEGTFSFRVVIKLKNHCSLTNIDQVFTVLCNVKYTIKNLSGSKCSHWALPDGGRTHKWQSIAWIVFPNKTSAQLSWPRTEEYSGIFNCHFRAKKMKVQRSIFWRTVRQFWVFWMSPDRPIFGLSSKSYIYPAPQYDIEHAFTKVPKSSKRFKLFSTLLVCDSEREVLFVAIPGLAILNLNAICTTLKRQPEILCHTILKL